MLKLKSKPFLNISSQHELNAQRSFHFKVEEQELSPSSSPLPEELNEVPAEDSIANQQLLRQLQFLVRPFQQKVYQPLEVCMKNGEAFFGKILEIRGASVQVMNQEGVVFIDGNEIDRLYWHGKPFPLK